MLGRADLRPSCPVPPSQQCCGLNHHCPPLGHQARLREEMTSFYPQLWPHPPSLPPDPNPRAEGTDRPSLCGCWGEAPADPHPAPQEGLRDWAPSPWPPAFSFRSCSCRKKSRNASDVCHSAHTAVIRPVHSPSLSTPGVDPAPGPTAPADLCEPTSQGRTWLLFLP